MPNWCSNTMTIYNPEVFKEKCVKDNGFSFDNVIPQPDHMRLHNQLEVDYPVKQEIKEQGITLEHVKKAEKLDNSFFTRNVMDYLYSRPWMEAEEQRTDIPADSWYEWDCANWGTKWDLSDDDIDLDDLDEAIQNGEDFEWNFDTAWAPPIPVLEKMAELGVEFSWSCEEPGCEIYMSGEASDGHFCYGDDEPPARDDEEDEEE